MPFFKDLSRMQISCKNQIKNSQSEKNQKYKNLSSPDREVIYAEKKGILLHLKKASLTVEAAFVIPVFFMAVICITSVMGVYSQTLDKMVSLRNSAEKTASAAGISESSVWIDLPGYIKFKPFFLPAGVNMFDVFCCGSVRAWTGRDSGSAVGDGEGHDPEYVYVTENGTVYHTSSSCTHIDLSITQAELSSVHWLRNENGERYTACEKCSGDHSDGDTVYITLYGNRYHGSVHCSGLKRSVRLVDISKIQGLKECERCASAAS